MYRMHWFTFFYCLFMAWGLGSYHIFYGSPKSVKLLKTKPKTGTVFLVKKQEFSFSNILVDLDTLTPEIQSITYKPNSPLIEALIAKEYLERPHKVSDTLVDEIEEMEKEEMEAEYKKKQDKIKKKANEDDLNVQSVFDRI